MSKEGNGRSRRKIKIHFSIVIFFKLKKDKKKKMLDSNDSSNSDRAESDPQEDNGEIVLSSIDAINDDDDDDEYNNHLVHEGSVPAAKEAKETVLTRAMQSIMKYPDLVGFIFTALSSIMFCLSSTIVKYISGKFSSYEIVFFRCIAQFVLGSIVLVINAEKKEKFYLMGHLDKKITPLLFGRGFFGSIAMILTFTSLHYLPLSDSILIGFLGPVFTAIWGFILLREKSTIMEGIGFCFSLMGITLVARPSFLLKLFGMSDGADIAQSMGFSSSFDSAITSSSSSKDRMLGTLAGLGYAIFSGLSCVLARKVGKGVHTMVVVNWLSFFGILVPIPIMAFTEFVMPNGVDWLYLFGIGGITTLGQCKNNIILILITNKLLYYLYICYSFIYLLIIN